MRKKKDNYLLAKKEKTKLPKYHRIYKRGDFRNRVKKLRKKLKKVVKMIDKGPVSNVEDALNDIIREAKQFHLSVIEHKAQYILQEFISWQSSW